MMKSRLDRNKFNYKIIKISFTILVLAFAFLSSGIRGYISDISSGIYTKLFINENYYTRILEENNDLKNKIEELNILISNTEENVKLADDGLIDIIKANTIIDSGGVLNIYSEILINKGSQDGVQLGAVAMVAGLSPVGLVSKVNEETSLVHLYSASGNKVEAMIEVSSVKENTVSNIFVATSSESVSANEVTNDVQSSKSVKQLSVDAYGDGKFGLVVKVDNSIDIATGSSVYLRSNPDYKLGSVVSVILNESEKEKAVYVRPNYSPNDSGIFYILK